MKKRIGLCQKKQWTQGRLWGVSGGGLIKRAPPREKGGLGKRDWTTGWGQLVSTDEGGVMEGGKGPEQ